MFCQGFASFSVISIRSNPYGYYRDKNRLVAALLGTPAAIPKSLHPSQCILHQYPSLTSPTPAPEQAAPPPFPTPLAEAIVTAAAEGKALQDPHSGLPGKPNPCAHAPPHGLGFERKPDLGAQNASRSSFSCGLLQRRLRSPTDQGQLLQHRYSQGPPASPPAAAQGNVRARQPHRCSNAHTPPGSGAGAPEPPPPLRNGAERLPRAEQRLSTLRVLSQHPRARHEASHHDFQTRCGCVLPLTEPPTVPMHKPPPALMFCKAPPKGNLDSAKVEENRITTHSHGSNPGSRGSVSLTS